MDDAVAITARGETGVVEHYTFKQLREMTRQMASALRISGLQVGDRVAGRLPLCRDLLRALIVTITAIVTNSTHAVVIALAVASIGGIFSSTATDMGVQVKFHLQVVTSAIDTTTGYFRQIQTNPAQIDFF